MASHERLALAFLPAVAVGRGAGSLQLTVVAFVADPGTLGATAERLCEAAGATLEYILVDVFCPGPGEAAGVVAGDDVEGGGVGLAARREDHRHQGRLLGFRVVAGLPGHTRGSVHEDEAGGVSPVDNAGHEGRVALGVETGQERLEVRLENGRFAD